MCRYARPYKAHYACFACRKTFKRRLRPDVDRDRPADDAVAAICPECGALTADMGLDFASPPKKDLKTWEHLKNLYGVGITFHSCGCSGPGYIPRTTEALGQYLQGRAQEYQQHLRYWLTQTETAGKKKAKLSVEEAGYRNRLPRGVTDKSAALAYWTEKLRVLAEQLTQLRSQLP